jgi:uncharacterized protein (DUF2062 family)
LVHSQSAATAVLQDKGLSLKYRYIRDRIRSIMQLDDPPHKLALAFSLGVFIAFTPTIGLHLISCLLLAWALRLSKLVIITGSLLNNPWTIVPLYGFCLWFGMILTGSGTTAPEIAWRDLTLGNVYLVLRPYLWPFVAGTLVAGLVGAAVSYALFYVAVIRYRKFERT